MKPAPTYVRQLTGTGKSAVAVVSIHGPLVESILRRCFEPATRRPWANDQIRYGTWYSVSDRDNSPRDRDASSGESVVLIRPDDDRVEVHCHGGRAAIEQIINSAISSGATLASAWESNTMDPLIAEARMVAAQCVSPATAGIAMDQCRGRLLDWTKNWLEQIDAPDIREFVQSDPLPRLRASASNLAWYSRIGLHLTASFRVVLAGPPNVGKSSLVNAILGYQRSITHDSAGTTRDVLHSQTIVDQLAITLTDTAGIRKLQSATGDTETGNAIEAEGIRRASAEMKQADVLVLVCDPACQPTHADLTAPWIAEIDETTPVIHVLHKKDLLTDPSAASHFDTTESFQPTSIEDTASIESLMKSIAGCLRQRWPPSGTPVPITPRQADWVERLMSVTTRDQASRALLGLQRGEAVP